MPEGHATHAPASEVPRVEFPYFPVGQAVQLVAPLRLENVPAVQPTHWKLGVTGPGTVSTLYPVLHTHCSMVLARAGESE